MDFLEIKDNPFLNISVASYELLCGIQVVYEWYNSGSLSVEEKKGYFRTVLGNAYRDGETVVGANIKSSVCHIISENRYQVLTTFSVNIGGRIVHYCLSFLSECCDIQKFSLVSEYLRSECNYASSFVRNCIVHKESFAKIKNIIVGSANYMSNLINSGIIVSSSIPNLQGKEKVFYASALSSHLQTQMTTIIEADNIEDALPIAHFLSNFMLPFQLSMSSYQHFDTPVRGLYLQCVKKVDQLPTESLKLFDRPWTWVRVQYNQVFHLVEFSHQAEISKDFYEKIRINTDLSSEDHVNLKQKYQKYYRQDIIKHISNPKSMEILNNILKTPVQLQQFMCQQIMREHIEKSLLFIEMIDRKLLVENNPFLGVNHIREISSKLGVLDIDGIRTLISFAQFFERRTFRRVLGGRKELLNELISAV